MTWWFLPIAVLGLGQTALEAIAEWSEIETSFEHIVVVLQLFTTRVMRC